MRERERERGRERRIQRDAWPPSRPRRSVRAFFLNIMKASCVRASGEGGGTHRAGVEADDEAARLCALHASRPALVAQQDAVALAERTGFGGRCGSCGGDDGRSSAVDLMGKTIETALPAALLLSSGAIFRQSRSRPRRQIIQRLLNRRKGASGT